MPTNKIHQNRKVIMIKTALVIGLLLILTNYSRAQSGKVYTLRNCQREMRTVTFQNQVNIIWKCVAGWTTLRNQRVLDFSPEYKLDTAVFESGIQKVKQALPPGFFGNLDFLGGWLDNNPDEPAIWFTQVFAQKDKKNRYKIFAAIKVVFDGNNAHIDSQRHAPKIKDLIFIFDKIELEKLNQKLMTSPKAGQNN